MFEQYPSLLITKLYPPAQRQAHVERGRLLAALDGGAERKLILIAAAAGFGKTTLVTEWLRQSGQAYSWLSLDERDNDPLRLLAYLVAGVQLRHASIGQELLAVLQSAQPPTVEHALYSLINQMAGLPERLLIVLDDYHAIENAAVHSAVTLLLERLPPQVTLVVLTRTDPPLPLARLRVKNELLELRAADLRFSAEEADDFLNRAMRLGMKAVAVAALEKRTEGWIAGLQLAALAAQSYGGDAERFVRGFTGSHRFVLDYLIEEVLARQPENARRFLLQTSVLRRLNGDLCAAVTGEGDGQAMLEYLERNNLFLIPLDQERYWYRYHHLFADLLQTRLQGEPAALVRELRQRAARWHEAHDLPEEAVDYALEAGDYDHAAALMTGPSLAVMRRGEVTTLLNWYRAFPADTVQAQPRLCLQFGLAFALNGRWEEAETLLKAVEREGAVAAHPDEVLLLSYLVASKRQDAARLEALRREAAENVERSPVVKTVLALLVSLKGDFRFACDLLAEAQAASTRQGDAAAALTALFHQCRFHVYAGNLRQAYTLSEQALHWSREVGDAALPMSALAHISLGRILIEWSAPDEAEAHLNEVLRLVELTGFLTGMCSAATMLLAEVAQLRGDSEAANRSAEKALALAERYDPPPEVLWLKAYQARLWLIQGNAAAAGDWLREAQGRPLPPSIFYPENIERVTAARVLLARRKNDEALALLLKLLAEPPNLLRVELLGLLALARQAHGDNVNALATLEQALVLAEAEKRTRVFAELGLPMAKLLARLLEPQRQPGHPFAAQALAAFPEQPNDATGGAIEPLSERELAVLRLIAAGQSNDEIAQTLTVAISTVKWYINVLYGKLHVKTRSQAIACAHRLKLLGE